LNQPSGPDFGRTATGKAPKSPLRPAFGRPQSRFRRFPGSSPAKIQPGRLIYGPEALLHNIEYMHGTPFKRSRTICRVAACGRTPPARTRGAPRGVTPSPPCPGEGGAAPFPFHFRGGEGRHRPLAQTPCADPSAYPPQAMGKVDHQSGPAMGCWSTATTERLPQVRCGFDPGRGRDEYGKGFDTETF
jgi:hypothetical protein